MAQYKNILALLVLCLVCKNECTPLTNERAEGRGIGSTLWGWITYPFTWWSSGSTDIPADENHITSPALDQDIEIATHNVTVWCNDQTCTTQRCDKAGCANTTCNIYDTDLNGECRHYNTVKPVPDHGTVNPRPDHGNVKPEPDHGTVKPEPDHGTVKPESIGSSSDRPPVPSSSTEHTSDEHGDERPMELEAFLSSTVTEVRVNDTKQ